jgi:hypothetical protein
MNQLLTSMGDASGRFRGAIRRAGERCEKSVWSQVAPVVKSVLIVKIILHLTRSTSNEY